MTGSYVNDESPEGGRFKKEVNVEGESHLLLIRDEAGHPDVSLCSWADGVLLVFSLADEESFRLVTDYSRRFSFGNCKFSLQRLLVKSAKNNLFAIPD